LAASSVEREKSVVEVSVVRLDAKQDLASTTGLKARRSRLRSRTGPSVAGITVKSGANAKPTHGTRVFRECFSPDRVVLVGPDARTPDAVPLAEFLSRRASDWFEDEK